MDKPNERIGVLIWCLGCGYYVNNGMSATCGQFFYLAILSKKYLTEWSRCALLTISSTSNKIPYPTTLSSLHVITQNGNWLYMY